MKIKIRKKWIIIIVIILIIIGYYIIKPFFRSPIEGLVIEGVSKGTILQEVSETGSVRATQNISLGFKLAGKIANIKVDVGDNVKRGDVLVELDSSQILAQLQSAEAALNYTTNQYDSGVAVAKDNLQSAYNSASNVLNDAYTKIYNTYNAVVSVKNDYFSLMDQEGIKVSEAKNDINKNMQDVRNFLDNNGDIDSIISQMLTILGNVYNDLKIIRDQCELGVYYSKVSSTDKTSLDTQKTNINTALTSLTTSQASISSYKIALQKSKDSTVEQAKADIDALQSQLNDNYLISPIDGIITEVNVKRGEVASTVKSAISLLSLEPFQIKAYIYEQDIINVKVGNDVKINLVAFPKKIFVGKILSINPAETIVDNVVYYEVAINFSNQPEGIRSGMTADVTIETDKKEDVLRIPKNAIMQIDGIETVQVVRDNKPVEQTITTGLEGNDYYEVVSGLSGDDQIIVGKK